MDINWAIDKILENCSAIQMAEDLLNEKYVKKADRADKAEHYKYFDEIVRLGNEWRRLNKQLADLRNSGSKDMELKKSLKLKMRDAKAKRKIAVKNMAKADKEYQTRKESRE